MQTCPKCRYTRTELDTTPQWQCPNCGVAYSKAAALVQPAPAKDDEAEEARRAAGRVCAKCNYARIELDTGPAWRCPNCGAAYEKVLNDVAPSTRSEARIGTTARSSVDAKTLVRIFAAGIALVALIGLASFWSFEAQFLFGPGPKAFLYPAAAVLAIAVIGFVVHFHDQLWDDARLWSSAFGFWCFALLALFLNVPLVNAIGGRPVEYAGTVIDKRVFAGRGGKETHNLVIEERSSGEPMDFNVPKPEFDSVQIGLPYAWRGRIGSLGIPYGRRMR